MGNKKGPDETELLAQEHLQKRFEKTIFEPDGNVAPDFLVNDIIAVEVRRLNQNENTTGEMRGLEESSIPLSKGIEKILEKFNDSETDHSWFVGFKFFRPLPEWRELKKKVMYELNKFKDNPSFEATIIRIDHSFEITFIPSTTTYPELYLLSGYLDNDAGGFILSEFDRNIKICIDEKANKITREKYKTWWLLLVDYFSYSLNEVDREYFKSFFVYSHPWEKIIIIDPRNPHNFFEI